MFDTIFKIYIIKFILYQNKSWWLVNNIIHDLIILFLLKTKFWNLNKTLDLILDSCNQQRLTIKWVFSEMGDIRGGKWARAAWPGTSPTREQFRYNPWIVKARPNTTRWLDKVGPRFQAHGSGLARARDRLGWPVGMCCAWLVRRLVSG